MNNQDLNNRAFHFINCTTMSQFKMAVRTLIQFVEKIKLSKPRSIKNIDQFLATMFLTLGYKIDRVYSLLKSSDTTFFAYVQVLKSKHISRSIGKSSGASIIN